MQNKPVAYNLSLKMSSNIRNNYVLTSVKDGVRIIKFNRPTKKNAICAEMYLKITSILNEDALNDAVVVTILTGVGDYYTSGNDISGVTDDSGRDFDEIIEDSVQLVHAFFAAFINYPKLLIAVVNGPAVGAGVTTLAMCDIVYASDRATFMTPFADLGLCPEGCSSFLFPRILGRSKASEVLMLGHKMTAEEAYQFGFVSQVIPHENLSKLFEKLEGYGKLSLHSVKIAKELINANFKDILHAANNRECDQLRECFCSDEFFEGLAKFAARKNKL